MLEAAAKFFAIVMAGCTLWAAFTNPLAIVLFLALTLGSLWLLDRKR